MECVACGDWLTIASPICSRHMSAQAKQRAQVWRVLKRRLYHYDAGVIAYRGFSRNFLLSSYQWKEVGCNSIRFELPCETRGGSCEKEREREG